MGVTPDMYVNKLNEHLGYSYGFADRCGGRYGQHDCSGYMVWAMNQLGLYMPCSTSFVMADLGYRNGMQISYEEARKTKAVWCISGPNGGRGPSQRAMGSDGHIACGVGDGTTREARGRAYGVYIGNFENRGWDAYFKIPGIDYSPPPPPKPKEEEEDMIIAAPARQQRDPARPACVSLDIPNKKINLLNGARVEQRDLTIHYGGPIRGWFEIYNPNGSKRGFKVIGGRDASGENPSFTFTWVK